MHFSMVMMSAFIATAIFGTSASVELRGASGAARENANPQTNRNMASMPEATNLRFPGVPPVDKEDAPMKRQEKATRIVGGVDAPLEVYKFMANWDKSCGGSLIHEQFVLSAAHCAVIGVQTTVRIGSDLIDKDGLVRRAVKIIEHPDYNNIGFKYDYALLKLNSPVDTSQYPPIALNIDPMQPEDNAMLTVIGFGHTTEGGYQSNELQEVKVPANPHSLCTQQYSGIERDIQLCAGFVEGGKDSCQGDSGGPLFIIRDSTPVQIGVVSFGGGCARPNNSGVYARVSGVHKWIQDEICKWATVNRPADCGLQAPIVAPIAPTPSTLFPTEEFSPTLTSVTSRPIGSVPTASGGCSRGMPTPKSSALNATEWSEIVRCKDEKGTLCNPKGGNCIPRADDPTQEFCSCLAGWTGPSCTADFNECLFAEPKPCSFPGGYCVDHSPANGFFSCGCDTSHGHWKSSTDSATYNENGATVCLDVSECDADISPCARHATCTNVEGHFNCDCDFGFVGDGYTSCELETHNLADPQVESIVCKSDGDCSGPFKHCSASTGKCKCDSGFFSVHNGGACHDEDECSNPERNNCHRYATCENRSPGYICMCNTGYYDVSDELDGTDCGHLNECATLGGDILCPNPDESCVDRVIGPESAKGYQCVQKTPSPTPFPTDPPPSPVTVVHIPSACTKVDNGFVFGGAQDCLVDADCDNCGMACSLAGKCLRCPQGCTGLEVCVFSSGCEVCDPASFDAAFYVFGLAVERNPRSSLSFLDDAVKWIVNDPFSFNPCPLLSDDRLLQRLALASLFFNTNGEQWNSSINWLSPDSECDKWSFVSCCDKTVVELELFDNNLSGKIPEEIGFLSHLVGLDLGRNNFTRFPSEFGQLVKLEVLYLDENFDIDGVIPTEIGLLTSLKTLDLSLTLIDGTIPTEIGNLAKLESLYLFSTFLRGSIVSEIGRLHDLKTLLISRSLISGSIPSELGSAVSLERMSVSHNWLSNTLPTELGSLPHLQRLYLQENDFSGSFPSTIDSLSDSLQELVMFGNSWSSGAVPESLCNAGVEPLTDCVLQCSCCLYRLGNVTCP